MMRGVVHATLGGESKIMMQSTSALSGSLEMPDRAASVRVHPIGPLLGGRGTLHHFGFAVASIAAVAEEFALSMSALWDGQITHDPVQRVRVAFFRPVDRQNPVIELVEPDSEASPVRNFLKKRVGLHHICYEIDDLDSGLDEAVRVGLGIVSGPTPAVAFGGRRIAWVCSTRHLLIEFLERNR
jgi:methylmalonyl-CoA/ethylmalonyl-CoA epimerase